MNEAKCRNCNKLLQTTQYVDGKIITRLTPDYRELQYLMSNESKMRVAICKECLDDEIKDTDIIKKVKKDWDKALELKYGKEKAKDMAKAYSKLKIVSKMGKMKANTGEVIPTPIKKEK